MKRKTMVHKILHRKQTIVKHKLNKRLGVNSCAPKKIRRNLVLSLSFLIWLHKSNDFSFIKEESIDVWWQITFCWWNSVESGVKHHQTNKLFVGGIMFAHCFSFLCCAFLFCLSSFCVWWLCLWIVHSAMPFFAK